MKKITTFFKLISFLILFYSTDLNAQNCIQTSQYPSGTVAIAQSGTTTVTTCNYGGEYSVNNFTEYFKSPL